MGTRKGCFVTRKDGMGTHKGCFVTRKDGMGTRKGCFVTRNGGMGMCKGSAGMGQVVVPLSVSKDPPRGQTYKQSEIVAACIGAPHMQSLGCEPVSGISRKISGIGSLFSSGARVRTGTNVWWGPHHDFDNTRSGRKTPSSRPVSTS